MLRKYQLRGSVPVLALHRPDQRIPQSGLASVKCQVSGHDRVLARDRDLSGYWSRRIDDEHRLVYRADDKEVKILKARYHYGND